MQSVTSSPLDSIRATFPSLDTWGARLAIPLPPPAGSELSVDDLDWPWVPVSQVAAIGLGGARDHLQAVRVHLDVGQLFPFAQLTLIRGALIGGAQAAWVLAPTDRERRTERARCIASHMYTEHGKYLDLLRALAPTPHQGTEMVASHVRKRGVELDTLRARDGQKVVLNTTRMVEEAARSAFGTDALATEALSVWRLTSGAAHGFAWPLLGQPDTSQTGEPDGNGIASFGAAGGIDRIANAYLCAYHLAAYAWRLWDERGQSP